MTRVAIGIDIGGSGIKGALVDLDAGEFFGDRCRIPTPQPSTPENVAQTVKEVVDALEAPIDVPVGVAMPAPFHNDVVGFMANLDQAWVGTNAKEVFEKALGRHVTVLNDADAAGVAECAFGAARGMDGTVIVTTLGTGIGSALIYNGTLIPNTELGHIELDGHDAETMAAASQKVAQNLSWEQWAERLDRYYNFLEMLFSPELIVVGGGVSKDHEKFIDQIHLQKAKILPAKLFNSAGAVGAAYHAEQMESSRSRG